MTPEPMIVQHDDRAIYHRRRWERTERSEICIADSFEYPNRCDWRCSHDREGCIRRTRNNSVGRDHMEIFVRPMRYKGCRQAHNAQVVICALFTTIACGSETPTAASRRLKPRRSDNEGAS